MSNSADYKLLLKQAQSLIEGESDLIANMANLASLFYHNIERLNWVGFYIFRDGELVLGPFCGQPACTRIAVGRGVCGTAYAQKSTHVIADVHDFDGHIACDAASNSELVVPIFATNFSGVFDIDSPEVARFGEQEKLLFEGVVQLLVAQQNGLN